MCIRDRYNIEPDDVELHGRLEPGKMFLVDMNKGTIINDNQIKSEIVSKKPYRSWLNENRLNLKDIKYIGSTCPIETIDVKTRQRLFNYPIEDIQ